jgi:uncharacterized protein YjbI with pentapeptide repeats
MKRRALAVVVLLALTAACTGTENAAPRARNSALGSVDVKNGNFAAGGGGWILTGTGAEVGAGCNSSGGDPSLGSWKKNALAFGYRKSTVTQSVVIPNPSTVVLKIDGAVRFDQSDSTFVVDLKSMTQTVSTGAQTGSVLVTPQTFTLSVTTSTPNEAVIISATGSSSKFWAGCYGPMLSNASIAVTPSASPIVIVAPTTSVAVAPTTTSTLAVIPTTTPATIAPVPTTSPAKVSPSTTLAPTTTVVAPTTTLAKVQSNAAYAVPTCVIASNANCSNTLWNLSNVGKLKEISKEFFGINFSGSMMRGIDLGGVKLPRVDFHQADLSEVRANGASFVGGNFVDAKLTDMEAGSLFEKQVLGASQGGKPRVASADFTGANFSHAQMIGAQLQGANLKNAVFTGADLSRSNLLGSNLDGADLRHADLTGIRSGLILGRPLLPDNWTVESGYLVGPGADLSVPGAERYLEADRTAVASGKVLLGSAGAKCPVVWSSGSSPAYGSQVRGYGSLELKSFLKRDLTGVNFTGMNLRGANFGSANLEGAVFAGANLESVDFSKAMMPRVSFEYATLNKTNFARSEWEDVSSGCTTALDAASTTSFPKGWKLDSTVSVVDGGRLDRGRISRTTVYIRRGLILGETANLANANLTGLNFQGVDLSNANLSGVRSASVGDYHVISGQNAQLTLKLPRDWKMVRGMLIGPGADLQFANLTNVDLRDIVDLSSVNLTGAFATSGFRFGGKMPLGWAVAGGKLVGPGVDLLNARFTSEDLSGVNLTGATLSAADLSRTNLTGASGVKIVSNDREKLPPGWRIIKGVLVGPGAKLDNISQDFTEANGVAASFTGVDLRGASLNFVEMKGISGTPQLPINWKVVEGHLVGPTAFVDYSKIKDLSVIAQENLPAGYKKIGNNVAGPNMSIINFRPRDLSNIDLSGSSFTNSDLSATRMTNVRAVNISSGQIGFPRGWVYRALPSGGYLAGPSANLSGLDLSYSNLSDVDLLKADLSGAKGRFILVNDRTKLPMGWKVLAGILFGPTADLSGVNLSGLDLSNLDLSNANLDGARGVDIREEPRKLPDDWEIIRGNLVGPSANLICTSLGKGDVPWGIERTARLSAYMNPNLFDGEAPKRRLC